VRAGPSHHHARRAAGDRGPWVSLPLRATIPEGNTVGQHADGDVGPSIEGSVTTGFKMVFRRWVPGTDPASLPLAEMPKQIVVSARMLEAPKNGKPGANGSNGHTNGSNGRAHGCLPAARACIDLSAHRPPHVVRVDWPDRTNSLGIVRPQTEHSSR